MAGDWLGEEQGPGLMRITPQGDVRWARALLEGASPEPANTLGSVLIGVPVIGPNNEAFVSGRTSVSLFGAEKFAPDGALDSFYAQIDVESGEVLSYVQTGDAYGIGSSGIVAVDASGNRYLSVYDYDLSRTELPNLYYAEKMNAEQETQWRVEFPSLISVVGVTSDARLYIVYDGALLGYSSEGDLETETELPADVSSVEVMVDGSVLFISNGFVVANGAVQSGGRELAYLAKIDPSDGEVQWKTDVHGATGAFLSSDGQALYVRSINDDEDTTPVFRLDASSGEIEWSSEIQASAIDATNTFLADVPGSGRPTIWISSAEDGAPLAEWY